MSRGGRARRQNAGRAHAARGPTVAPVRLSTGRFGWYMAIDAPRATRGFWGDLSPCGPPAPTEGRYRDPKRPPNRPIPPQHHDRQVPDRHVAVGLLRPVCSAVTGMRPQDCYVRFHNALAATPWCGDRDGSPGCRRMGAGHVPSLRRPECRASRRGSPVNIRGHGPSGSCCVCGYGALTGVVTLVVHRGAVAVWAAGYVSAGVPLLRCPEWCCIPAGSPVNVRGHGPSGGRWVCVCGAVVGACLRGCWVFV